MGGLVCGPLDAGMCNVCRCFARNALQERVLQLPRHIVVGVGGLILCVSNACNYHPNPATMPHHSCTAMCSAVWHVTATHRLSTYTDDCQAVCIYA